MGRLPIDYEAYSIPELRQRLEAAQYLEDETRMAPTDAKVCSSEVTVSSAVSFLPLASLSAAAPASTAAPSLPPEQVHIWPEADKATVSSVVSFLPLASLRSLPAAAPASTAAPTEVHAWSEADKAALASGIQMHNRAWAAIARDQTLAFSSGLSALALKQKTNKLKSYANSETFKTYMNTLQIQ